MAVSKMRQTEIVSRLAEETGLNKADVQHLFEELLRLALSEVKKKGEFTVPGFGKLVKTTRRAREGRNPATGATITIPAKSTIKFRPGKAMIVALGLSGDSTTPIEPDR